MGITPGVGGIVEPQKLHTLQCIHPAKFILSAILHALIYKVPPKSGPLGPAP